MEEPKKPILDTIRALLEFKDRTTIAEIARVAVVPQKRVLDVLNKNGHMVYRDRSNGNIIKVTPRETLRKQLKESPEYYFRTTFGAWAVEGYQLTFRGNQELADRLKQKRLVGGIGDCWTEEHILDTPENRKALEDAGLKLWDDPELDDRLWVE